MRPPPQRDPDYYKYCGNTGSDDISETFQNTHQGFIRHYLDQTEPLENQPTHSKILSIVALEVIYEVFFTKLRADVIRNAAHGWKIGSPFPETRDYIQPIGDTIKH